VVFWAVRHDGEVLVQRRPEKGLLGGMMEFPSTPWRDTPWNRVETMKMVPFRAKWKILSGTVRHSFTHFHLELIVWHGTVPNLENDGIWVLPNRFSALALPTLMKKVAALALTATSRLEAGKKWR
jgi:A/G-specific adenine glycosylase